MGPIHIWPESPSLRLLKAISKRLPYLQWLPYNTYNRSTPSPRLSLPHGLPLSAYYITAASRGSSHGATSRASPNLRASQPQKICCADLRHQASVPTRKPQSGPTWQECEHGTSSMESRTREA